jgi:hypothetical protein
VKLSAIGERRRRNFSIKKKVVISPGRDDGGDYLDAETQDEGKRLKRVFFETYLEASKNEQIADTGEPMISKTIFERDDSPTEAIEQRSRSLN